MSLRDTRRGAAALASALCAATVVFASAPVRAEDWKRGTTVSFDLGMGSVITDYNRNAQPGGTLVLLSARVAHDFTPRFGAELVLRQWMLPGSEYTFMPGLGGRYRAYQNAWGSAFADLALGPALMPSGWHLGVDLGGTFEIEVREVPGLAIGPFLRFAQVTNTDTRDKGDGRAWSLGVTFSYDIGRGAEAAAEQRARRESIKPFVYNLPDTDRDGVTDDADQCVDEPIGRFPDRDRPGCPQSDEDQDGVPDPMDRCPLEKYGSNPDRTRPGCPISDRDRDEIVDAEDACPDQAGPRSNEPAKNGCPEVKPVAPKQTKPAAPAAPEQPLPSIAPTRKRGLDTPR